MENDDVYRVRITYERSGHPDLVVETLEERCSSGEAAVARQAQRDHHPLLRLKAATWARVLVLDDGTSVRV